MVADPGCDDKKLYEYKRIGNRFGLSYRKVQNIPKRGLILYTSVNLYWGNLSTIRGISVEPLIEHIKSVFRIDPLPVRGFHTVSAIILLSVLLYR